MRVGSARTGGGRPKVRPCADRGGKGGGDGVRVRVRVWGCGEGGEGRGWEGEFLIYTLIMKEEGCDLGGLAVWLAVEVR
jgi:hypothetical protein